MSLRDAVYGAAVGDALGVPYEFKGRDSFVFEGMIGNGSHGQPAGTFSDDTSMMLATCDSIRECGQIDCNDMRSRFNDWLRLGRYAPGNLVFDVGGTVGRALTFGVGCADERDNGNGSLMRIAPLAFTDATDNEVRAVSAITHAHKTSTDACVRLVHILQALEAGEDARDAIEEEANYSGWEWLAQVPDWPREDVKSGGYVLDTLGASLWCVANTDSYETAVAEAVSLGGDTDTTACVAGALAGALYGLAAIPRAWLDTLRGKEIIENCLF